jgi:thiol:disulfide interchange protein DsbD
MGGIGGSFFTGVLAVIVASPCTAPFMGVALGFGLAQPTPILLATFLSLGLGLAFPYIIFAIFPSWIRVLPKPGIWMMRLKQVMALPLLATDIWLLWILAQVQGNEAVTIVAAGLLALAFAFWLSSHRWRKLARGLTVVALLIGLGVISARTRTVAATAEAETEGIWKPYSPAALEAARSGPGAFVNMTADWCLTCKVNERLVFSDPQVQALLLEKKITLLKGDWTQRNEDITLFLNHYDRVGVPFYVLYSPRHPSGQPLPEVLTKSIFIDWIAKEFP